MIQLVPVPDSVNLNPPIVFVAYPAPYPNCCGIFLDEPSEANTLYSPGYKPAPCFYLHFTQLLGGASKPVSVWLTTS